MDALIGRCLAAELELELLGWTDELAQGAVRMNRRIALGIAGECRSEIREQVAVDVFESRMAKLRQNQAWLKGYESAMSEGTRR